jgi:hypothetical protein
MYIYHAGYLKGINHTTGEKAVVLFHKMGWTGSKDYKASGGIFNTLGEKVWEFDGKWTDKCSIKNIQTGEEVLLETVNKLPEYAKRMYHLGL